MTEVRIRLDLWGVEHERSLPEAGVVTNIYDVTQAGAGEDRPPSRSETLRGQVIPAGPMYVDNHFLTLDLSPGEYLVEVVMPSGDLLTEPLEVSDSGPQEVRLFAGPSPREWLGWQKFAGNVEATQEAYGARYSRGALATPIQVEVVTLLTPPVAGGEGSPAAPSPDEPADWLARGWWQEVDRMGAAGVDIPAASLLAQEGADPGTFGVVRPQPLAQDEVITRYLLSLDTLGNAPGPSPLLDYGDFRSGRFARTYLYLRGTHIPAQLAVVPLPWAQQPDFGGEGVVDLLVDTTATDPSAPAGTDLGHRIAATVDDRRLTSVIGYLASGQTTAAGTVIRSWIENRHDVMEMLYYKVVNPFAAAAAGYVLMSAAPADGAAYWHEWVRNLSRWFRWLPDGAIQYAWLLLSDPHSPPEARTRARDSLLAGYRRGLPYFSMGVSWLLDGLTLVVNAAREEGQSDGEAEAALRVVRRVGMRTNMRQAFTCIRLS